MPRSPFSLSQLTCNPIDLDGENIEGFTFAFDDAGDNACGCPGAGDCRVVSPDIVAPPAL